MEPRDTEIRRLAALMRTTYHIPRERAIEFILKKSRNDRMVLRRKALAMLGEKTRFHEKPPAPQA